MANEKVSQMVELSAGEVASNDLFLIVDTSAKESKKLQAASLVNYVEASGSFDAYHADLADTASYVNPATVGLIPSASHGIRSLSASHALKANLADTASYALVATSISGSITNAISASYLIYSANNGTASSAISSSWSQLSTLSNFLLYTGNPNGTASWAVSSSNAQTSSFAHSSSWAVHCLTASYVNDIGVSVDSSSYALFAETASNAYTASEATHSISSSYLIYFPATDNGTASYSAYGDVAMTASYVDRTSPNIIQAWADIIWTSGKASPIITNCYNIESITYTQTYTAADPGSPSNIPLMMWTQWKVLFNRNLPSTRYMLIGNVDKMLGGAGAPSIGEVKIMSENAHTQSRFTNGFTMSLGTPLTEGDAWFSANGNKTWYADHTGSCRFMIVGLPT